MTRGDKRPPPISAVPILGMCADKAHAPFSLSSDPSVAVLSVYVALSERASPDFWAAGARRNSGITSMAGKANEVLGIS